VVGVAVGVIAGDSGPLFFNFGSGDLAEGRPFTNRTSFAIGSVTKVFTTNLLGQAVSAGTYSLGTPLSAFSAEVGTLQSLTSQVTLKELADFTGGIEDTALTCPESAPRLPACLPYPRPNFEIYTAADFAAYLRGVTPLDFSKNPLVAATMLPAPAYYSDFSTGILGLLLGATPGQPWSNQALTGWSDLLQTTLLNPLGMRHTGLFSPTHPSPGSPFSQGYSRALGQPKVDNGSISQISMTASGNYSFVPGVRIEGGGGTGASAEAVVSNGGVSEIKITDGGTGYLAPPTVQASGGEGAEIEAVIAGGKVVGFNVSTGGKGYSNPFIVTVAGGRQVDGHDATGIAHIVEGQILYVTVTDEGAGYLPPLSVLVDPAPFPFNETPIWAPAGALTSTMEDMMRFASAALGDPVPQRPEVTAGFEVAETPYACANTPGDADVYPNPSLLECPAANSRYGMTWTLSPTNSGLPTVLAKNGGLPGYSTDVRLMPTRHLAVVVFANTRETRDNGEHTSTRDAEQIAGEILNGLYFRLPAPRN
jgi:CubicO group peptidase (beta-lactamase class C family)